MREAKLLAAPLHIFCGLVHISEYSEPEIGWIGEASQGLLRLGKQLEQDADQPPLPAPPVWTDSKLRRREALKKLAQGQKLSHDSHSQSQGMMGY